MKLIQSNVELLQQEPGIEGMYKIIDKVAGICYNRYELHKDSKAFVDSLIEKGHLRPLEFGTVYLEVESNDDMQWRELHKYCEITAICETSPFAICKYTSSKLSVNSEPYRVTTCYITTNYRFLVENNCLDFLEYWCEPTEHHFKRPCVHYNLSRGILDEFRTHITLSHMAKSTRYCNESKKEMKFIKPYWFDESNLTTKLIWDIAQPKTEQAAVIYEQTYNGYTANNSLCTIKPWSKEDFYIWNLKACEFSYNNMIELGAKPQEARDILPLGLATELCSCGYIGIDNTGWNRFFEMRCDKAAHPDAEKLADETKQLFIENGYI